MKPIITLIADDSSMILKIIKKALLANTNEQFYFEENSIFTASDGMEAFTIMAEKPNIKLIISDINMPQLSGFEFVEILQDLGKIDNLDILFVTSTVINMNLHYTIKDKVLGTIYKPFNTQSFNEKMLQLYKDKENHIKEVKQLKEVHKEQKKKMQKISVEYLKHFNLTVDINILDSYIDEYFQDDEIPQTEYAELIYAILSLYFFQTGTESHKIDNKRIFLILGNFNKKVVHNKDAFRLIQGYIDDLDYVNNERLTPQEVLFQLSKPLIDKISLALASSKKHPKQVTKRFESHFKYIIEELEKEDCLFFDDKLQKLLLNLSESTEFSKWLHNFLKTDELIKKVPVIKKNSVLYVEIIKRLKHVFVLNNTFRQHLCGELDAYIWKRAKASREIVQYLKTNMSKKIPNSLEFLHFKEKVSSEKYKEDYKLDMKNVIVISNNLDTLKTFKSITHSPFDNWSFHAFSKQSLLDVWLHSNKPDLLILDYNFKTAVFNTGIQFLKSLKKIYPIFKKIIENEQLLIICTASEVVEIQALKLDFNFTLIDSELNIPDISKTLTYT